MKKTDKGERGTAMKKLMIYAVLFAFSLGMAGVAGAADYPVLSPRAQDSESSTGSAAMLPDSWPISEPIETGAVPDRAMSSSSGFDEGFYSPRAQDSETSTGEAAGL